MKITGAFGVSHAGLIATRRDEGPADQVERVYDAFATVAERIKELRPDAVLIVATDHMQAHTLASIPTFTVGVGPVAHGLGDAGLAPCEVPVHQPLAQTVLRHAVESGFDMCFTEHVGIDHSFVMPLEVITPSLDVPIVPVSVNCNVPPRPLYSRCVQLGETIREAIEGAGDGTVVVVATGGLSHWVGSEERRDFMNGLPGTRLPELANYPLHIGDAGYVNVEFDRELLQAMVDGEFVTFMDRWPPDVLEEVAGNGAQELRNWLVLAGLLGKVPAEVLAYEPVAEWHTGTAVVEFSPAEVS